MDYQRHLVLLYMLNSNVNKNTQVSNCVFLPKVVQWFLLKKAYKNSKNNNFLQFQFWFNKQLSIHSDPARFLT